MIGSLNRLIVAWPHRTIFHIDFWDHNRVSLFGLQILKNNLWKLDLKPDDDVVLRWQHIHKNFT